MSGSVRKRGKKGSNRWSLIFDLGTDSVTGKRQQQWLSFEGTHPEAVKKLTELMHSRDNGVYIKPGKTTFAEYLERWLKDYATPNLSPRTAEGYEHICRHHVIPALGKMALSQVKPEHLQRYYAEKLSGGLSAQTVRHHHTCIHKALQTAVEWGILSRNIADAVRAPRVQHSDMQTWNEDEVTTFLNTARETPYYCLFYLALYTGMRRSELLALRWVDVDLLMCQIHVSRSLHVLKGAKVVIRATKTAKGRRMVALSPSTVSVLREHFENEKILCAITGIPLTEESFVFSDLEGKSLLPNTVTHAWIKLVRKAGVKPIRLHDARHTHASLMLKQGVHPKIVQERLGHSSVQITLDTYSHVAPGLQEAAAARFDEAFSTRYNVHENEAIK